MSFVEEYPLDHIIEYERKELDRSKSKEVKKSYKGGYKEIYLALPGHGCESCGSAHQVLHQKLYDKFNIIVCTDCVDSHDIVPVHTTQNGFIPDPKYITHYHPDILSLPPAERYSLTTFTTTKDNLLITTRDISALPYILRPNPRGQTWAPMKLYLRLHLLNIAIQKHGSFSAIDKLRTQRESDVFNRRIEQQEIDELEATLIQRGIEHGTDRALLATQIMRAKKEFKKARQAQRAAEKKEASMLENMTFTLDDDDIDPNTNSNNSSNNNSQSLSYNSRTTEHAAEEAMILAMFQGTDSKNDEISLSSSDSEHTDLTHQPLAATKKVTTTKRAATPKTNKPKETRKRRNKSDTITISDTSDDSDSSDDDKTNIPPIKRRRQRSLRDDDANEKKTDLTNAADLQDSLSGGDDYNDTDNNDNIITIYDPYDSKAKNKNKRIQKAKATKSKPTNGTNSKDLPLSSHIHQFKFVGDEKRCDCGAVISYESM